MLRNLVGGIRDRYGIQNGGRSEDEEESLKGAAEENRILKEQLAQLKASHRRATDDSAVLSRSLKQEQAVAQQSLRREEDEKDRALSQNQRLAEELDDLRRQLESKDAELRNLQNGFQHSQKPEYEDESLKETADENQKPTERLPRLKVFHQRSVDESTTLSQSQQLMGVLDSLRRQLENRDVELENLRNALQEGDSFKGAAEENRKLKEEVAQLRTSYQRAVDESTALSRSLKREEDKAVRQQSLGRGEDENAKTLSQNRGLMEELNSLRRQLESKDVELRNLRSEPQHSQKPGYEEEPPKGTADEGQRPKEHLPRLKAFPQRPVRPVAMSLSLKREQGDRAAMQQSLRREEDEKAKALSQNERLMGELDDLRRQLESKDVELKNLRNEFQRSQRPDYEQESVEGAADEMQKPKERLPRLKTSRQRPVDESTALSQSLKREQEDNAAMQQALRREEDEKVKALSRNERLTGELDGLRHQLEDNDVELKNLRNELQRLRRSADEQESLKRVADESRKPKERLPRLKASHQRAVDESTALSQSPEREQEAKAVTQQALRQGEDDESGALSQDQRVTEELDELRSQLESKDVELRNLWNALQHEEETLKGAAKENRILKEQLARLRASHRRTTDEYDALSQLHKREQEDKVAIQQALRREKDEKGRALSRNEQLAGERDGLMRQLESNDVELRNLRNALQHKEESYKKGADENRRLREEIFQLDASYRRAVDESTTLSQSLKREQEVNVATQRSLLQEAHEKAGALSRNEQLIGELEGLRRQVESHEAELGNLRSTLQREKESFRGAAEENQKLKEEVAQLMTSHQRAVDESAALSELLKQEQEDKTAAQQSLLWGEDEKGKALSQNQRLTEELGGLKHQLENTDSELKSLQNELQHAQTKHDELTALLEARGHEPNGAQTHPTKPDTLSSTEVTGLIDALNIEILQASAFISDSFEFASKSKHVNEIKEASARISEFTGAALAHLLGTVLHTDDPLLVQIALQGATIEFSRRVIVIVTSDLNDLQTKQPLTRIHDDIRERETQEVGRRRTPTRARARKVAQQEGDVHTMMAARLSDILVTILVVAGCTKSHKEIYRTFTQQFGERISNIVKMALRLNKAVGEEVTSADLRPMNATSGKKFDMTTMANFEPRAQDLEGQTILCTTALGLQRSEKVVRFEFKTTTLLKPKVALESVADDLDRDEA